MKLTAKLLLVFVVGITIVTSINGYLAMRREQSIFAKQAGEEADRIGTEIDAKLSHAWNTQGPEATFQLARQASRDRQLRVRLVWLDASEDVGPTRLRRDVLEKISRDTTFSIITENEDGEARLLTYWPLRTFRGPRVALEFDRSMKHLSIKKREMISLTLLQSAAIAVVCLALTSIAGIQLVGEPLKQLIKKTKRIAAGDLGSPLDIQTHDELGELADSLNLMCNQLVEQQQQIESETNARIKAVEQLRHADRLRTVGRLASGVAHELGTPLHVVAGRAALIESGKLSGEEVTMSAAVIKGEAERMTRIIRQLLDFSRRDDSQKSNFDLRQVVAHAADLMEPIAKKRNVLVEFVPPNQPVTACVDIGQVQQVIMNLLQNAIQATPDNGSVNVCLRIAAPGGQHIIEVQDFGIGIDAEHIEHLFEPFFTTKEIGEGTGLGLSVAYSIVQDHGGTIEVDSVRGKGSVFRVLLPTCDAVSATGMADASVDLSPTASSKSPVTPESAVKVEAENTAHE